jgi:hypothetical protein
MKRTRATRRSTPRPRHWCAALKTVFLLGFRPLACCDDEAELAPQKIDAMSEMLVRGPLVCLCLGPSAGHSAQCCQSALADDTGQPHSIVIICSEGQLYHLRLARALIQPSPHE